jgi:hypothetical protein
MTVASDELLTNRGVPVGDRQVRADRDFCCGRKSGKVTVVSITHMRLKAKDLDLNDLPLHDEAPPNIVRV